MKKLMALILLLFISVEFTAQSRYTKSAENGYAWLMMGVHQLPYKNSKFDFLSSILEQSKLLKNKFSEYKYLFCEDEINLLMKEGDSKSYTLEEVVKQINRFYSEKNNLKIPIVFAYCYVIKKEAGLNNDELNEYKKCILKFCE